MAITMKGLFRGLKNIAQIFTVQREHEIEIGYPTDVRHVSHIGIGASGSCPSWMSEFRGAEEMAAAAGGVSSATPSRQTSWASLDFEQPCVGALPPAEASSAAARDGGIAGTGTGSPKKATARPKNAARASSPSARSSS